MNFSLLNIPLSDSSCKVFSMNLTAESHCCFSLTDQSSRAVSWITRWEVENRAVTNYTETDSRTVSNRHLLVFSFPISWPTKNQVRLEAEMSKLSRDDTLHVRLAEKFAKPKERCQNQSHKAIHQFWVKKNVQGWFCVKTYFFLTRLSMAFDCHTWLRLHSSDSSDLSSSNKWLWPSLSFFCSYKERTNCTVIKHYRSRFGFFMCTFQKQHSSSVDDTCKTVESSWVRCWKSQ